MGKDFITSPDWMEPQTADYIHRRYERLYERGADDVFLDQKRRIVVTSPYLQRVWRRAAKYFPNVPFRGQIELFDAIWFSFRTPGEYVSEREATAWKDKFLAKVSELIKLAEVQPDNFDMHDAMFAGLSAHSPVDINSDIESLNEEDFAERLAVVELLASQADLVGLLAVIEKTVSGVEYSSLWHAGQFRGGNAERAYFVRSLSQNLMRVTGEWKRSTVAEITSVAFSCNYTPKEVVRCTKGLEAPARRPQSTDAQWVEFDGRPF